jgi:hypothetical protein
MGEDNAISSHTCKLPIFFGRVAIDIVGEVIAYNSLVHSIPQNQNPIAPIKPLVIPDSSVLQRNQ